MEYKKNYYQKNQQNNNNQQNSHLLNNQIRANKILLLDKNGDKLGDFSFQDALKQAYEQNLDLVQMGMSKDIAICKMLKYDSWLYHEKKKKEKQEFKNRGQDTKTMNFRPGTGEHDFQIKMKKVKEFLEEKHKVKFVIKLKSREISMQSINQTMVNKIVSSLEEVASLDSNISYSQKEINFLMKPEKKQIVKKPQI